MKLTKKFIKENPEMKLKELLKPALEVGKWYKIEDALFNYQKENKVYGFLFGKWIDENWTWYRKDVLPATPEEIKNALEKEAVKRYSGKIFISLMNKEEVKFKDVDFDFFNKLNVIYSCGYEIFNNGTWATIIKTNDKTRSRGKI